MELNTKKANKSARELFEEQEILDLTRRLERKVNSHMQKMTPCVSPYHIYKKFSLSLESFLSDITEARA